MEAKIEVIPERKLIGVRLKMTLSNDKTQALWKTFMPMKAQIKNNLNSNLYSMNIFGNLVDFKQFTQSTIFEKWAAVEVSDFDSVPGGMESHLLSGGKYAVFIHKGPASTFFKTSQYIFGSWLPNSEYELDQREHFEILGATYRPNDLDAKEEVWIPVK